MSMKNYEGRVFGVRAAAAVGLVASLALSGCSANHDSYRKDDVKDCGYYDTVATNVVPTYIRTDPHYSEATDPQKLLPLDKADATRHQRVWYGMADLVCNYEKHSGAFSGSENRLVLTQRALDLAADK
jgi:hypothetical protein